jgi:hypothetical protein
MTRTTRRRRRGRSPRAQIDTQAGEHVSDRASGRHQARVPERERSNTEPAVAPKRRRVHLRLDVVRRSFSAWRAVVRHAAPRVRFSRCGVANVIKIDAVIDTPTRETRRGSIGDAKREAR